MSRSYALSLVGVLWLTGCESPCGQTGECTGTITIDMTTDPPTFGLRDLGETHPDQLEVRTDATCGGAGSVVWEIDQIQNASISMPYGVTPAGAREQFAPEPLVDGVTYRVGFLATAGSGGAATIDWSGFFTSGDPESAATDSEFCP